MEEQKKISRILIVMAMHHEAFPVVEKLALTKIDNTEVGLIGPLVAFRGTMKESQVFLVLNGDSHVYEPNGLLREKDGEKIRVNRVGVVPASISTWEGVRIFQPDLILSIGTAGGLRSQGIKLRTVYIAKNPIKYFDRLIDFRAPNDAFEPTNYKCYGIGSFRVVACPNLLKELNIPVANVGTSSSFAHPEGNIKVQYDENECAIKEMEAAAIAEVADMFSIPFLAIKGVTDYVDVHVGEEQSTEFASNLTPVSELVAETAYNILQFLLGKTFLEI